MCSSARLAITSFAFMWVLVPAPPWITSTTNCSCSAPPMRSSQACTMALARAASITPSSAFACAAAFFTKASARTSSGICATVWPEIGKLSTARAV